MSLLTKQQYEMLRQLIYTQKPLRVIAMEADVSQGTVVNFRRACVAVDMMSKGLREKVRLQLLMKTPVRQIAAKLNLPIESIYSLRRIDRFRKATKMECSECGTLFFPQASEIAADTNRREKLRGHVSRDNTRLICDIMTDLLQLDDLQLITHPLFHHLAQRAERVYRKINESQDKEQEKEKGGL